MSKSIRKKFWIFALLLALSAPILLSIWYLKLAPLAYHWAGTSLQADQWRHRSLWLPSYRVTLDAHPIKGITKNLSGLTYNHQTHTLFTVINDPAQIAEITLEGRLLRRIPVTGIDDLEGISHLRENLFVLIDERKHRIYWEVPIEPETQTIDVTHAPRLSLDFLLNGNLGFEGITWSTNTRQLFVAKEKPPRIFEIHKPLRNGNNNGNSNAFDMDIQEWSKPISFMRDLSSLSLHDPTGHMLVMSDESKLLAEYSKTGELISILPLRGGWHGLKQAIPQAEGVTVAPDGTIYIVSEPNLFYRLERSSL